MNTKSHVSLERRVCLVCATTYDTGALLLDKRLRASMERHTTTGWGLCPEHRCLHDEGFVALVECDPQKSGHPSAGATIKPEDAYRTGLIAHVRREAFEHVFNTTVARDVPCVFVELGVINRLQAFIDKGQS